jgi:hypothetical protein
MAVLNPPSALPGLARAIVNHLLLSRAAYDEERLTALFAPADLGEGDVARGVDNTLRACRALGVLVQGPEQRISVSQVVQEAYCGAAFTRDPFRVLLRSSVLDLRRDGDPWLQGEGRTAGAKDLMRALAWFLNQDALGSPLSWRAQGAGNVQTMQARQLPNTAEEERPIVNDTRWSSFTRWVVALGFAEAATALGSTGLVPLPVRAVRDVVQRMPAGSRPIEEFLGALARDLPVLPGGSVSEGLRAQLSEDTDPSRRLGGLPSGVAQSLLILEDEGLLTMSYGADAAVARTLFEDGDSRQVSSITLGVGVSA